jgi:hypothetical protein
MCFDSARSRAPGGASEYCIPVRERARPDDPKSTELWDAVPQNGRGDTFNLTLGADWLFQDVSTFTQSNNQLAMLTLGLTFF